MATLSQYKKQSQAELDKIYKELNKVASPQQNYSDEDNRFWQPEVDKAGNGYAVIRFLPPPDGEDVPFVRVFTHGFKGPTGSWYIENSLTTLGQNDPVSEYNSKLWNSGIESDKDQARAQKRRLTFISNVQIVKDPANPENEGKVFLYKYGKKIFDKLNDAMNPKFEDEKPVNPFDPVNGANFKVKIRQVEGYRNYEKSEFDSPSAITEDEKEWAKIEGGIHSLQDFLHPRHFKSYDELKQKFERVMGIGTTTPKASDNVVAMPKGKTASAKDDDDIEDFNIDDILDD